jgi:hypothetical protein
MVIHKLGSRRTEQLRWHRELFGDVRHFGPDKLGTWNDVSDSDAFNHGYVIEYAPIPEPSAPALVLVAAVFFGLRRK